MMAGKKGKITQSGKKVHAMVIQEEKAQSKEICSQICTCVHTYILNPFTPVSAADTYRFYPLGVKGF